MSFTGQLFTSRRACTTPGSVVAAQTSARVARRWLGGFVVVLLGPVTVRMLVGGPSALWSELTTLSGLLALSVMVCTLVLACRLQSLSRAVGMTTVMYSHRFLGVLVAVLVLAHIAFVIAAHPPNVSLLGWVDAPPRARAATAATLALAGLIVLGVTRHKVRQNYELWRWAHLILALAALALSALHVWLIDKLVQDNLMRWVFLGLAAVVVSALAYRWHGAAVRSSEHVVRHVRVENDSVCTVVLDPRHAPLRHDPGQFAWLRLERRGGAEEHPFTIASSPVRGGTEITLRSTGDFGASLRQLTPGTPVWIDGPYGAFTVDLLPASGMVMLAAGMGITPMMSMLRTLAHRHDLRPFLLVRSAREIEELFFRDELAHLSQNLDLTVVEVVRCAPPGWRGVTGEVDVELLRTMLPGPARRPELEYFLCGPPTFVACVMRNLEELGVPDRRVHTEQFDSA